ncbi:hypothetical protein BT96DRAFT_700009 [Gymnopus androsaceus JB14]|uniref:C2 domain-containing protein n=1 Tax=Gymnopus androsaceus JB14 TaxID=1447944 RepID=A0A6A4III3_9AGAR|nr:hypothetical protein BT96DRAFT_700009 [Gymnopus androsaceus JB14]
MSGEEEIGTLIVVVLKAQNLHDKHFFKQDVYAQITFNGETKKTKIDVKGGQHPMWDEEIRFPVYKIPNTGGDLKKYRELTATCWAKEHKDDSLLGEGKVDMTATLKSGEFDDWVPLKTSEDQRGEIYLEITYYSNAPVRAPAPARAAQAQAAQAQPSSLLAPPQANLGRRPSKLSPKDRLSRGPYSNTQQQSQLGPPTPPKGSSLPLPSTLKPGPAATVPSTLLPGAGPTRVSPKQQNQPLPAPGTARPAAAAAAVPSILRPGNPQADPHPSPHRRESSSPPRGPGAFPNPYTTPSAGPIPFAHASSTPAPGAVPPRHHSNSNGSLPYPYSTNPNPDAPSPRPTNAVNAPYTHTQRQSSNPSVLDWNSSAQQGPHQQQGSIPVNAPYTQPYTHAHRQSSNPPSGPSGVLDWNSSAQQGPTSFSFPVPNFPQPGIPTVADEQPTPINGGNNNTYYNQPPPAHVHQRTVSYFAPSSPTAIIL